ncbi:TetR family transcriptional regulator [Actinomadura algeriensis]|uniref:AcrR family transcriptional regulator n=1 Tax=Actinomadura algeriensis TaxID=1679523 RepID=A0ABR9K213_9ACTN|nr:TetR family transcriptional regulator [Actinomadura algeriensis]MBE1536370.1 AcrR family transcriptional regulator [Actinomadura algeriensis]
MPTTDSRRRYPKGAARRAEILRAALDAYAASDRQGPRLRDIAAAVGLTEAGVLHYFDSKDHLFVAILEARDRAAAEQHDLNSEDGVWGYLEETMRTPGLTKLFLDMSAAASDPGHPAHAFMARHDLAVRRLLRSALGTDDPWVERIVIALAEGLQARWLRDPATDLVGDMRRFVAEVRANRLAPGGTER